MSAQGMAATVIWTQLLEAMRKDFPNADLPEKAGTETAKVIREMASVLAPAQLTCSDEPGSVPYDVWQERVSCARMCDQFAHEEGPGERRYSGNVMSARILGRTAGQRVAPKSV